MSAHTRAGDTRRHAVTWTRDAICEALQAWTVEHGRAPSSEDWYRAARGRPNMKVVVKAFGSFAAARDAASVTFVRRNHAGDFTRSDVVDAVTRWVFLHGRTPRMADWHRPPAGFPSCHRVVSLFGTWNGAIVAAGYRPARATRSTHSYRATMSALTKAAA